MTVVVVIIFLILKARCLNLSGLEAISKLRLWW